MILLLNFFFSYKILNKYNILDKFLIISNNNNNYLMKKSYIIYNVSQQK